MASEAVRTMSRESLVTGTIRGRVISQKCASCTMRGLGLCQYLLHRSPCFIHRLACAVHIILPQQALKLMTYAVSVLLVHLPVHQAFNLQVHGGHVFCAQVCTFVHLLLESDPRRSAREGAHRLCVRNFIRW